MPLIVFEGIDGTGKTTQIKRIADWLQTQGKTVWVTKEPTDGKIGKLLREYLKDPTAAAPIFALLFAADRVAHSAEIKQHLDHNDWVLSDRYVYSSIAYQAAQGLPKAWVEHINTYHHPVDCTFLFDADPEITLHRRFTETKVEDREIFEKTDFLQLVRRHFLDLQTADRTCIYINADQPITDITATIILHLQEMLKSGR